MATLNEPYCYLASPIDQTGGWDDTADREKLRIQLAEAGFEVYDPKWVWRTNRGDDLDSTVPSADSILSTNEEALSRARYMLAVLPDGVPSVGVPVEIAAMITQQGMVAVLAGDAVSRSLVLRGWHQKRQITMFPISETQTAVDWLATNLSMMTSFRGKPDLVSDPLMTVSYLVERVREYQEAKGWLSVQRTVGDLIALVHSELSEALEEFRKDGEITEAFAEEMADVVIRVAGMANILDFDLEAALWHKLEVNDKRSWRHGNKAL